MSDEIHTTFTCPICNLRLRVPLDCGDLRLTCPKCRHFWDWAAPASVQEAEKTDYGPWTTALLAECASAEAVLDDALEANRSSERPLIVAAFQSLLAYATWCALKIATPNEASMISNALCEHLAARSRLPSGHFPKVWAVVFQLLSRQPATAKNAESLWARVAFALGDAGYDAPHIYDCLWVQYTALVFPNFNIRVFEAAGGRNTQHRPSPKQSANALATANDEFRAQFRSLAEKVMGDKIGNAEFRRTIGAVLIETNLRKIQGIED